MGTYLYHYGRADHPMLGLFVTPAPGMTTANLETLSRHPLHRLGVLAFDITGWDDEAPTYSIPMENIHKAEETFVKEVNDELGKCHKPR